MKILLILVAAAFFTLSCDKKTETASAMTESAPAAADTASLATEIAQEDPSLQKVSSQPALNPAHGEPYHRCDIEVGAPLSSAPKPAQQVTAPQLVAPQPAAPGFDTNPISPAGPKPALNPPHGEPHHRCDLQVGAPLS